MEKKTPFNMIEFVVLLMKREYSFFKTGDSEINKAYKRFLKRLHSEEENGYGL